MSTNLSVAELSFRLRFGRYELQSLQRSVDEYARIVLRGLERRFELLSLLPRATASGVPGPTEACAQDES